MKKQNTMVPGRLALKQTLKQNEPGIIPWHLSIIYKTLNQRKKENIKYLYILYKDHKEPNVIPSNLTLKTSSLHMGITR